MKYWVQVIIVVVVITLMAVGMRIGVNSNSNYYFIDNSTNTVYDGTNVRSVNRYRGGDVALILNDGTVIKMENYTKIKKENYKEEKTEENYYLSICTAENESQLIDENGNIWVTDLELIPECRYSVMFTDNGTKEIEDDLIVEFKLIHE